MATVYLLHFERKYHHAQHYLGITDNLQQRLEVHRSGQGSPLVRAAVQSGISFQLAKTWQGDRYLERHLKSWHKSRQLCPICRAKDE